MSLFISTEQTQCEIAAAAVGQPFSQKKTVLGILQTMSRNDVKDMSRTMRFRC